MENEEFQEETLDVTDDTLNVTEEQPQIDSVAETELTVDDYNRVLAEKEALERKNKQLYARINKTSPAKPLQTTANADTAWRERLELKVEGYKDDEIDFIQKNGGRKALENPIVKTAIDSIRTQRTAENAVVDTDTTKSDVERKYTPDQLRDMPVSELEKLLPKA